MERMKGWKLKNQSSPFLSDTMLETVDHELLVPVSLYNHGAVKM